MISTELYQRWADLSNSERVSLFRELPHDRADQFFLGLSSREQVSLLLALPDSEQRSCLRLLPPDDAADLIQLAPEEDRASLAGQLDDVTRREVSALLAYKEDEAGGLMNPRYARVRPDMTVDEAVSYLRQQARAKVETIYVAYVLDDQRHLLGVVSFRELFAAADHALRVRDIMRTE